MDYFCNEPHGVPITKEEFTNSMSKFMRPLCKNCQENDAVKKGEPLTQDLCRALLKRGIQAYIEYWDGIKHVDIGIPKDKIYIEVDGIQHNTDHIQAFQDLGRTYYAFQEGIFTLRLPNSLVSNQFEDTVNFTVNLIKKSRIQLIKLCKFEKAPSARIFSGIKRPSEEVLRKAKEYMFEIVPDLVHGGGATKYDERTNRFIVGFYGDFPEEDQLDLRLYMLETYGIDVDFQG